MAGLIKREGEAAAKRVGTSAPFEALNLGTLGNVGIGPDGRPSVTQDPRIAQAQNQLLGVSGQAGTAAGGFVDPTAQFGQQLLSQGGGMLADAAGFDPLAAAEARFSKLQSVLAPNRDRTRDQLESKLLAQGRLDSTGGNVLGGELEAGFAGVDANLMERMFLESQQMQNQAQTQGMAMGQAGSAIGGGLFGQLQQGTTGAQGLDQGLLQSIGASGEVGSRFGNADIARANAINSFNASPAAGGKGSGMAGAIGTIAGGGLGFIATGGNPAGAMAGAQAGGALGNLFT